jgi:hypothetical protein
MEIFTELEKAIADGDSSTFYRSLRKAIKYSQAHPEISIPNQSLYLWGNTELTQRLMELENMSIVSADDVNHALLALIRPPLNPDEALDALISLQL